MTGQEAQERLCKLISLVGEQVYHSTIPHDCICGENHFTKDPVIAENIVAFIEGAVHRVVEEFKGFQPHSAAGFIRP